MSFGGSIKLTGESDYRRALQQITKDLKDTSSALKTQATEFNNNNKSVANAAEREKELTKAINEQKTAIANAQRSYSQYSVALQTQQTRHNALTREYKNAVLELDRVAKASGTTSDEYKKQAQEVERLEGALVESTDEMDKSKRAMSDLKTEINNASKTMNAAQKEVDELGKETKETGEQAEKAGDGFTVFKGIVANLAANAISAAVSGLKKLGGALINVGKEAVNSYAQYEQLVGGVETLFKESAPIVQKYAEDAYKTAGMSANTYMETVTGFSASLLQGLGGDTEKAAQIAHVAITDMADNANKMGTSMESIQYAYQGFAKQNYTMLDNLKLGYGGTKAEMARLVKESGILGKAGEDLTAKNLDQKVSFDQMIEAIHKVQEQMGITGTTSAEAANTIEGSSKSMQAAWSNLLTSIADDNADLSKSIDIFTDAAITSAKNLVPRIKNIVKTIKTVVSSIVTEVFPKLKREVPQLKPLIETFEWFIKNRNLVVGAVGAMVAAFAVNKILNFTKGLSDTAKGLIDVAKQTAIATTATNINTGAEAANTTGKIAATTATGALRVATNLLNAAWAANPIGVVITGISLLVGALLTLKGKTEEMTDEEKAYQEALKDTYERITANTEAWDELSESQQNQINVGMTEADHLQDLWKELQGIVDQNGKVKEGYEKRADFIATTLSEALGTEIKITDGVIQKNDELSKNIDKLIEKKKAQTILDAQESKYKKAIEGQTQAVKDAQLAEENRNKKQQELSVLEAKMSEVREAQGKGYTASYINGLQAQIDARQREVDDAEKKYKKAENLAAEYGYTIMQHQNNLALFHDEQYSFINDVTWKSVKEHGNAVDAKKAQLEDEVANAEYNLKLTEKIYKDSNDEIAKKTIEAAKKNVENAKKGLEDYKKATESGLKKTEIVWSDSLADQLSEITGHKVEFKNAGKGNVQMVVDGQKIGAPKTKEEMAKMTTDAIKEITKKEKDAKKAAEDLIDGFNNGVKNQDKQSSVFSSIASFGSKLLGKLKASLQEKSPSKATAEMGSFLLEGLGLGIEAKEASTLKQVTGVGRDVLKTLNGELSKGVKLGNIGVAASYPKLDTPKVEQTQVNKFDDMVAAFKTALSQMKIELDDEVAGEFVERTVARAIYT